MTLDETATVVSAQDYYPFGGIMENRSYVAGGNVNDKYKFTGKERDVESGYDYFPPGRTYDSEIGRWLQVDPMFEKYPGWSPYNYTLNNPLKYFDPNGQEVKVYTERLGSGTMFRNTHGLFDVIKRGLATLYGPRHTFMRVTTDKFDYVIELSGPQSTNDKKGLPHKDPFNNQIENRPDVEENQVYRPKGVKENDYSFENNIVAIFDVIKNSLPDYDAVNGPNSNGFIRFLIEAAGGGVKLPEKAWNNERILKYWQEYKKSLEKQDEAENKTK
ncbi:MAG: RHS repeat-associated core domain-containing protein [Ignavibacteria bacterium]|nr:RHS repeat-associated core domain-containing protein [Ignavibacteria bacterium]